jgi:tetratricopeptide (TPR) repeat protein
MLAFKALQIAGTRPGQFNEGPMQAFSAQLIYVRLEQGRLAEVVPQVEGFVRDFGWVTGWRCALAYVYALVDRRAEARAQLEGLDFEALPRDALWLLAMAHLSEVVTDLDDAERAARLYPMLAPYADRCIVALGACCLGSVARSLGRLATTVGRYDEAAAHLERAIAVNTHIRSPVWTAHAQLDYAELLRRRGEDPEAFIAPALATARRLGLKAVEARA